MVRLACSSDAQSPLLPAHLRNTKPDPKKAVRRVSRRRKRCHAAEKRERALHAPLPKAPIPALQTHEDFYSDYHEDWIDVTEEAIQDYLLPTHVSNDVPSRVTYALDETVEQAMVEEATVVRQAALATKEIDPELHEQANTVHGIKDLLLAQNRDVHVLAIKNLVARESIDQDVFPEDVCAFARNYHKQKQDGNFPCRRHILGSKIFKKQLLEKFERKNFLRFFSKEVFFKSHNA